MIKEGFQHDKFVEFRQTIGNFAAPTKELEKLLLARKIRHGGEQVLRWMAGNVTVRENDNGDLRPDKGKSSDKIDGIVSLIMALGLATNHQSAGPSVYEGRGLLTL